MPIWTPDRHDVEFIAKELAARYFPATEEDSPSSIFGVVMGRAGDAALESALGIVRQPYYRYVHSKAGALLRSMIKNHAFVDGNKRIAVITTVVFLHMNKHVPYASNADWVSMALKVAASEPDTPWPEVSRWIRAKCVCLTGTLEQQMKRLVGHEQEAQDAVDKFHNAIPMV